MKRAQLSGSGSGAPGTVTTTGCPISSSGFAARDRLQHDVSLRRRCFPFALSQGSPSRFGRAAAGPATRRRLNEVLTRLRAGWNARFPA